MKTIDLRRSIHDLCKEDPEVIEIMVSLGFEMITSPGMLNTAGRVMTLPKGAMMKNIPLDKIRSVFTSRGYTIHE